MVTFQYTCNVCFVPKDMLLEFYEL